MGNLDHKPWHLFEFLQIKKKFVLSSDSNVFLQRRVIFFLYNCKICNIHYFKGIGYVEGFK